MSSILHDGEAAPWSRSDHGVRTTTAPLHESSKNSGPKRTPWLRVLNYAGPSPCPDSCCLSLAPTGTSKTLGVIGLDPFTCPFSMWIHWINLCFLLFPIFSLFSWYTGIGCQSPSLEDALGCSGKCWEHYTGSQHWCQQPGWRNRNIKDACGRTLISSGLPFYLYSGTPERSWWALEKWALVSPKQMSEAGYDWTPVPMGSVPVTQQRWEIFREVECGGPTFNPSIGEEEAARPLWVWSQPGFHSKFQASQVYIVGLVSKQTNNSGIKLRLCRRCWLSSYASNNIA